MDNFDRYALDQNKEASGIHIYMLEELGDARLRCAQLKKFIDEAVNLINKSEHRDHFFETAAHLIYGIPETLLKLDKALSAAALGASKLDYEEIKEDLRPEKVEELEAALEDVRVKRVDRRGGELKIPEVVAKLEHLAASAESTGGLDSVGLANLIVQLEGQTKTASTDDLATALRELAVQLLNTSDRPSRLLLASTLRKILADVKVATAGISLAEQAILSRFEEGKPADPTENMSPEDAKKWKEMNEEHRDNFKSAADWKEGAIENLAEMALQSRFEEGQPADPTENMSEADAEEWNRQKEKHKDEFKAANVWKVSASSVKQASGPSSTGSNWKKIDTGGVTRWVWDDGTTSFHVREFQGPGIPLYSMQLITSFGEGHIGPLKLRRPAQTKSPEQMFTIAANWYKAIQGFIRGDSFGLDLTKDWSEV